MRRLKLVAAAALMYLGSWMVLGHAGKAVIWTVVLFGLVWLAVRTPPGDRHVKP